MAGEASKKKEFKESSVSQNSSEENTFSEKDSVVEKSSTENTFSEDKSVGKKSISKEVSVSGTYMETTRFIDLSEDNTAQIQLNKASQAPAALTVLVGPEDMIGVSWPIEKAVTTIGRSASLADIHISHTSISRSHFQLLQEDDRIFVMDLKS
ncbi:MAG: FHA domain-containing protein, partial [Bdellovibrionales bacterium]|nr:FHA domain-containing protein [Bdellovibrionales bacterium]